MKTPGYLRSSKWVGDRIVIEEDVINIRAREKAEVQAHRHIYKPS